MKLTDEEKKALGESVAEGLKSVKADIVSEVKTLVQTEMKTVTDRIEKIEKSPATRVFGQAPAIGTSKMFRKYNLGHQLVKAREMAAKNPSRFRALGNDEKADELAKFLIAVTRVMKGDVSAQADIADFYAKAAYAEGADATGGYIVPDEYQHDIIQLARNSSFLLQSAAVYNMQSDTLRVPKEGTLVSVAWNTEANDIGAGEGTFDEVVLSAKRLDGMATVSNELLQDAEFDLAGILLEQFAYATGQELDNQSLNGTGSPFNGMAGSAAGYSVVMGSGSTAFSKVLADDFSLMISKLKAGYLNGAKFLINRQPLHYVRTLKDTNNSPIFAMPGMTVPGTIYGLPYEESEVANGTDGASKCVAVLGNWKKFALGRRIGAMTLESDPYGLFGKNQTRFRMVTRWGMKVGIAEAFVRYLTHS